MGEFDYEDQVAAEYFKRRMAEPQLPNLDFWRRELAAAGNDKSLRAGVIAAALSSGVAEDDLLPSAPPRRWWQIWR